MSIPSNSNLLNEALERARNELLDLGLRNPLLNFRTMKARGLQIIDGRSAVVLDTLIGREQPLYFAPVASSEPAQAAENELHTPYEPEHLQKRLLYSQDLAQSTIQEKGANILFLAVGMLYWRPKDRPHLVRAPLLLVPVAIQRATIKEHFYIEHTGTSLAENLTLKTKLAQDFDIELPSYPLEETDFKTLSTAFDQIRSVLPKGEDWRVEHNEVELGFFAYNRFILYDDLNPSKWTSTHSPVLNALYGEHGFHELQSVVKKGELVDKYMSHAKNHLILEADSTQLMSLIDARQGMNLVIQGPPGTGKSQTITNLIGEALGQGKRVLFVAEKLAALEVVKRKLAGLGLDDLALELHGHKTTKRDFAAALSQSLTLGSPTHDGTLPELDDLKRVETTLNDHSFLMNRPVIKNGPTPFEAYGQLIALEQKLSGADWSAFESEFEQMCQALRLRTADEMTNAVGLMRQIEDWRRQFGLPTNHPFTEMGLTQADPSLLDEIREATADWHQATGACLADIDHVRTVLNVPRPNDLIAAENLISFGEKLQDAPYLIGFDTANQKAWFDQANEIVELLTAGQRLSQLQATYEPLLIPEAWSADLLQLRGQLMVSSSGVFRHLSSSYRDAKQTLAGLCRDTVPTGRDAQLVWVDAILEVQRLRPIVNNGMPFLQSIIGPERLTDIESADWTDLLTASLWLIVQHQEVQAGNLPVALLDWLQAGITYDQRTDIYPILQKARKTISALNKAHHKLNTLIETSGEVMRSQSLDMYAQQVATMTQAPERLLEMVDFRRLQSEMRRQRLETAFPFVENWTDGATHLADLVEFGWMSSLTQQIVQTNAHLENFDGATHDEAVDTFRSLDKKWLAFNRVRLAHAHREGYTSMNAGGISDILISESQKRANNRPIRELIALAGERIQQMRPLFMMSPLSIATFLPPGEIEFDLVIFDEASQVRPVDALGAILRGKQTIVVGDNKQLPPTSFFDTASPRRNRAENEDDETGFWGEGAWWEDDEPELENLENEEAESILDLFLARGAPQRMLRWHYRSQHESLISLSNREFYDHNLVLFPSPDGERSYSGLQLNYNPHTVYDRGNSRTNRLEAADVATAVLKHARNHPELSLGVATFSSAQQQAIQLELERVQAENSDCEPFFKRHEHEPFFVKNLENVQGDERDVIFISVGYGRDQDKKVRLNFGPLNGRGGERRLNVLITRSRLRCVVFTNLTSEDIDLKRSDSVGVAAFKAYLAYAETGELPVVAEQPDDRERPFFESVKQVLEDAGHTVEARIGRGGVEVDLAVRLENGQNIAIELDGRDYHRALSARDRDRIQQEVLTRLGWDVHRLWIHDWFRDRARAEQRLLAWLNQSDKNEGNQQTLAEDWPVERLAAQEVRPLVFPPYPELLEQVSKANVPRYALDLLRTQWPMQKRHLLLQVWRSVSKDDYNFLINNSAYVTSLVKPLYSRDDFYLLSNSPPYRARNWEGLQVQPDLKSYDIWDWVPPEDFKGGVLALVKEAIWINPYDVPVRVAVAMGLGRVGRKKQCQIFELMVALVKEGSLLLVDGELALPNVVGTKRGNQKKMVAEMEVLNGRFRTYRPSTRKKQEQFDLPIQAEPYRLAQNQIPEKSFIIRPINGWNDGVYRKRSMEGSNHHYPFDLVISRFMLEGDRKIDYWSYYDFEVEPGPLEISGLYSIVAYDFQLGKFYHDGTFGMWVKTDGAFGMLKDWKERMYRVWRNPADGLFYGRMRSDGTRNYHLSDSWAQGRRFGSAQLNICLSDLADGIARPEKCKKLKAESDLVEVAVEDRLEYSLRKQEFDRVESILIVEEPIHVTELQRRIAAAMGNRSVTSTAKNFVNQVLDWSSKIGLLKLDGDFVMRPGIDTTFDPRERSALPSVSRKLDYVPDGEIKRSIELLKAEGVVLSEKNVAVIVSQFLGVRKATGEQAKRILAQVARAK